MEREPYPFETEIMERFSRGGKLTASHKGEWIRGYLITFGIGYPYKMWKEYVRFSGYIGIKPGTYLSFARYMWILKKLGLIKLVRREETQKGFMRSYYRITPGMENSPLWRRPGQAMYPSIDWTRMPPETKKALREKYRSKKL